MTTEHEKNLQAHGFKSNYFILKLASARGPARGQQSQTTENVIVE